MFWCILIFFITKQVTNLSLKSQETTWTTAPSSSWCLPNDRNAVTRNGEIQRVNNLLACSAGVFFLAGKCWISCLVVILVLQNVGGWEEWKGAGKTRKKKRLLATPVKSGNTPSYIIHLITYRALSPGTQRSHTTTVLKTAVFDFVSFSYILLISLLSSYEKREKCDLPCRCNFINCVTICVIAPKSQTNIWQREYSRQKYNTGVFVQS